MRPTILYDGQCEFCKYWVEYWKQITREVVKYSAFQDVADQFPKIPRNELNKAIHLVQPDGQVLSAAEAVFTALSYAPRGGRLLWLYKKIPGFAYFSEAIYKFASHYRGFSLKLSKFFWGSKPIFSKYHLSQALYLKLLGIVYLIAFVSAAVQITALIGSSGILPIQALQDSINPALGLKKFILFPTLTWISAGNGFLYFLTIGGALTSLALIFSKFARTSLIILWVFYLSITTSGSVFFSFQWDILLLEAGFLAIFLAPGIVGALAGKRVIRFLHKWLLFRLVFLSGYLKILGGDTSWRDLTALTYHFETQPLPTSLAWTFHNMTILAHELFTFTTLGIELLVPFLLFLPRRFRMISAAAIISLEIVILLTGNYTFFNILTIALALFMFDDAVFKRFIPKRLLNLIGGKSEQIKKSDRRHKLWPRRVAVSLLIILVFLPSLIYFAPARRINAMPNFVRPFYQSISAFRLSNGYGLFIHMTKVRREIVIEGSTNGELWEEYHFKYKPGKIDEAPRWVAPHQPRLDWQMWFAALNTYENTPWFANLVFRLLEGNPVVLRLLESNPFPDKPPKFIRAVMYEYEFTNRRTKKETGAWWDRVPLGLYITPAFLTDEN